MGIGPWDLPLKFCGVQVVPLGKDTLIGSSGIGVARL